MPKLPGLRRSGLAWFYVEPSRAASLSLHPSQKLPPQYNREVFVGKILKHDDEVTHAPDGRGPQRCLGGLFLPLLWQTSYENPHLPFVPLDGVLSHTAALWGKVGSVVEKPAKAWHKCWVKANENREGIQICVDECQPNLSLQIESSYHWQLLLRQSQNDSNFRFWLKLLRPVPLRMSNLVSSVCSELPLNKSSPKSRNPSLSV